MPPSLLLVALSVAPADRVAVFSFVVEGREGSPGTSRIYAAVAEALKLRPRLRLLTSEEMFVADPNLAERRVEDCGTDAGCLSASLRPFSARYGLLVVLNFQAEPPLLGLRLVDVDEQRIVEQFAGAMQEAPLDAVRREVDALFSRGGYVAWGEVVVHTEPKDAAVRLGDGVAPRALTPPTFLVPPGRYLVSAASSGHEETSQEIEVSPGASEDLRLKLPPLPESPVYETWWFWTAVGAVVVAGAATAAAFAITGRDEICVGNADALRGC